MVTGLFRDKEGAERAWQSAVNRGYDRDDISLLMSDETRRKYFADETETGLDSKAQEDAETASKTGGKIGAIAGAVAAVGSMLALPGIGIVIAGPLWAALAGAGKLTGSAIDAMERAGILREHAEAYEAGINEGGIVMGVNSRNEEDAAYFEREWKNNRGEHIYR